MRRSITISESRLSVVDVSVIEARLLNELGRSLASKVRFWKTSQDEPSARSVIRVTYDGAKWTVIVRNAVGMIRVGDLQIRVLPKIPMKHFIYLLSVGGNLPRFVRDDIMATSSRDLLELVAHWFMTAVDGVLKRDLIRDYVEVNDHLRAARGQMDALETGSLYYSGRLMLSCRFDDLELNTPLNRILKAGARIVSGNAGFTATLRRSAWRILQRLDTVGDVMPGDLAARSDRRTEHYEDALMLARLLIGGEARAIEFGECSAWSFLIPTPDVVERSVRAVLVEALAPECAVTNRARALTPNFLKVNPDLVFEPALGVGDVKYKVNWDELPRAELYQVVSFAAAYHSNQAALVSFKTDARKPLPDVHFGDTSVRHFYWDARPDTPPAEAADSFVGAVRTWLRDVCMHDVESNSYRFSQGVVS